jgi:hypothetical protein
MSSVVVINLAALPLRRMLGVIALVAGCLVAASASATPLSLATPAGLNPGDQFRFVFVTVGTITATSSDIEVYNSFVNTQAAGATYGGSTVSWKAIGSTATVDARDNVGGYGTFVPVYLVDGTKVAGDLTNDNYYYTYGMWSGDLLDNIWLSIDGTDRDYEYVWTGSDPNGLKSRNGDVLGSPWANYGNTRRLDDRWIWDNNDATTYEYSMYAMSETLTVVPEIDPAGMGSVLALVTGALGFIERRRLKAKLA